MTVKLYSAFDTLSKQLDALNHYLDKRKEMTINPEYDKKETLEDSIAKRTRESNEAYVKWNEKTPPSEGMSPDEIDAYLMKRNRDIYATLSTYTTRTKSGAVLLPTEEDPIGIKTNDPGAKLDKNKPDLDLVLGDFSRALIEVGKVGTFGADKYSRHGWLSVPSGIRRYSSALLRHIFFWQQGELVDEDSKLLHLSHSAWNALAILELTLRENQNEKPKICNKLAKGSGK